MIGLAAGAMVRAPAMLLATAGIVVATVTASVILGRAWETVAFWALASAVVFQAAYLAGLALVVLRRRKRTAATDEDNRQS